MTVAVAERTAYTTKQARIDLAAAHRLSVRRGLKDLGLGNHFTMVDPENPGQLLSTPEYESWVMVTASNLTVIESEEQAAADPKLWINYRIHWPIHQAREDAVCVMHLHPPYLTALSMIDETLGRAHQGMTFLDGKVGYTQEYDGKVGHQGMEQGKVAAEALGETNIALIMRNHGVLVVGPSVASAFTILCALEGQAQYRILALSTGKKILEVPDEALPDRENFGRPPKQKGDGIDQRQANFDAQKRVLDRFEPDYCD